MRMRVCPHHLKMNWQGEPLDGKELFTIELQKLALNSGTTGGARKKASIPPKKNPPPQSKPPYHRRHNRHMEASWRDPNCRCLITRTSSTTGTAPAAPPCTPCRWTQRACQRPCSRTARQTTSLHEHNGRSQPSMNCEQTSTKHGNCGTSTVFCSGTQMHLSSQQRA